MQVWPASKTKCEEDSENHSQKLWDKMHVPPSPQINVAQELWQGDDSL